MVAVQVHLIFLMDLVLRVLPKAQAVLQLDQILQLQQHLLQQLQQQTHITQTYQLLEQLPFLGILIQIN